MGKIAATLLIITAPVAGAQVRLPNVSVPGLPQTPILDHAVPRLVDESAGLLQDVRRLRLRELVRRNRTIFETDPAGNPVIRSEVLIVSPSDAELNAALAGGFTIIRTRVLDGLDSRILVLAAPSGLNTRRALARLRQLVPSATVDFNHIYTDSSAATREHSPEAPLVATPSGDGASPESAATPPNGPAPASTAVTPGSAPPQSTPTAGARSPARVGLIDSGVYVEHPVFEGATIHQHGCSGSPVPAPHGTAVASLLMGRSAQFHGVAAGAELFAADVFCGQPTGGAADAIAEAFGWMAHEHVAVINVSLVGPPNATLEAVVRLVIAKGHLIVAAVGNDGPAAAPLYPASYPGVVGVTAVDVHRRALIEAGRGPQVKFAAPGADMSAAGFSHAFELVRGTSYAAPIVAGLLALMLPEPDKDAVARVVVALAHEATDLGSAGVDSTYGYGLVGADLAPDPHLASSSANK